MPELCCCGSHALSVRQDGSDGLPESVWRDPVEADGFPNFAPLPTKSVGVANGQGAGWEHQVKVILAKWISLTPAQHFDRKRRQEVALP